MTAPREDAPDSETESDLAATSPASLTVSVRLPEVAHIVPDEEAVVALDRVAISPAIDALPGTMSIEIDPEHAIVHPEPEGPEPEDEVVPLPEASAPADPQPDPRAEDRDPARSALTTGPDRDSEAAPRRRVAPEGFWQRAIWVSTFHLVDPGDSAAARARKALDERIGKRLAGGTRFVPVLTRKGGVGKTTISALLGMALADVREDRVVAIDANPDRGTLADRVSKQTRSTVRDVVIQAPSIRGFTEFAAHVSRDATRLDVLASDPDPLIAHAFDEDDYNVVADIAARHYSIVITDCGTGVVHSVMRATLQRADAVVIVSGGSIDEARLASETLTWLEANDYGDLVRNAVVALNTATQGTDLVKLDEIEAHFRSRVRSVVRIPYDEELAAGSVIRYGALRPFTKAQARLLAARVMDGLPSGRDL